MSAPIFGWTPAKEEDVDTDNTASRGVESASPLSTSSLDDDVPEAASPIAYPSQGRVKKGDPNWIPRPRNGFIIFRCEYSRDNARGSAQTPGDKHSPSNDKTMSKRAGEAWRGLSKARKNHYKLLAEKEKMAHALAHPGYRYRPTKRAPAKKRRQRWNPASRAYRDADSHLESYDETSEDDDDYVPSRGSPVEPTPKHLKRRSTSVPVLPPLLLTPQERLGMRRTKSELEEPETAPASPPSMSSTSSGSHELLYSTENNEYSPYHVSSLGFGSPTPTATKFPVTLYHNHTPPLAAVSSTLAGWNGEMMAPSLDRTPSTASSSSMSNTCTPVWGMSSQEVPYGMAPSYMSCGVLPRGSSTYAGMPHASFWPTQEIMNRPCADNTALQSYHTGLASQVTSPDDFMIFDTPIADEQRIFDGFCHF